MNSSIQLHLFGVWIVEEVCPVGIRLHVSVDEQLAEEQLQEHGRDVISGALVHLLSTLVNGQSLDKLVGEDHLGRDLVHNLGNVVLRVGLKDCLER